MGYLGWFDDSKQSAERKIADAIAAYVDRYHVYPTVVLCSAADNPGRPVDGVAVRVEGYIRRNNFWAGEE